MIVYGRNPVREALRGRRRVLHVWSTSNASREAWLASQPGFTSFLTVAGAEEIERRCGSPDHQGICAEVSPFEYAAGDELLAVTEPLIVALDQVQDPQNLGSICRSAECAGATAVVIPERRAAEVTPAVCKASAGAVEHLRIGRVRNIADFLEAAKARGIWCYGAAVDGELRYDAVDYAGGVVLVLGAEGRGLRPRVASSCDALVAIPMRGMVQSLNVSAAAAVLTYAAAQARFRA